MSPQELFDRATDVLLHCDSTGVQTENAESFIASLQSSIGSIHEWLPPVLGTVGYSDGQLIDHIRQVTFHSERALRNFPVGVGQLSAALVEFRRFLQNNYFIQVEDLRQANQG